MAKLCLACCTLVVEGRGEIILGQTVKEKGRGFCTGSN